MLMSAEFFPLGTLYDHYWKLEVSGYFPIKQHGYCDFHSNVREKDAILHTTIDRTYMTSNSKSLEQESNVKY